MVKELLLYCLLLMLFSKCGQVVPLKDQKHYVNLDKSDCGTAKPERHNPNKIRVNKGSEFYNRSIKSWLWYIWYWNFIQHIMKENLLLLRDLLKLSKNRI